MFVLFDLEWVTAEDGTRTMTQLAALRTDGAWQSSDSFSVLVKSEQGEHDWEQVAYNGYSPDEFRAGMAEEDALQAFFNWLKKDDVLCCWHYQNGTTLAALYKRRFHAKLPCRWAAVNDPVYALLFQKNITASGGLYACAGHCSLPLPVPEHCSYNDVRVLQALLSTLQLPGCSLKAFRTKKTAVPAVPPVSPVLSRRELTAQKIARLPYNYIYLPHSSVFHRRDCKLVLNSHEFFGSIHYQTAAQKRRPCKMCKPVPEYSTEQEAAHREEIRQRAQRNAEIARKIEAGNEVIHVRLLGYQPVDIRRKLLVGCCHNRLHPGRMTQKLMEQHDCLGKQCRYFEKYEAASYWQAQAIKAKARQSAKTQKQQKKAHKTAVQSYRELFQSYADAIGYPLQIIRVQEEKTNVFKLFYVSENSFRDGNLFPNLLSRIREERPSYSILMRHIQDVDGHFVTIEEYQNLRK